MRIGILTFSTANNYGAQLQAHALQKQIQNMGHTCLHIKIKNRKNARISIKETIKFFLKIKCRIAFFLFRRDYIEFDKKKYTSKSMAELNKKYDLFISGSDQVWNMKNGLNPFFYQMFVSEKRKKVAYAASIGLTEIPEQRHDEVINALDKFNLISVREHQAQKLLELYLDKKIAYVLDPVLLFPRSYWDKLLNPPTEKKPYIFVYGTEMTKDLKQCANRLSQQTGLAIKTIYKYDDIKALDWKTGPLEFLNYVKYAEYIVTTSFHCTAFSILFQKKLIEILHSETGIRAYDLLDTLRLTDCIYDEKINYAKKTWDYSYTDKILSRLRTESLEFLENALRN